MRRPGKPLWSYRRASRDSESIASKWPWMFVKAGARYELELELAASVAESRQRPEGRQKPTRKRGNAQEVVPQKESSGSKPQAGAALSSFDAKCWPHGVLLW